jgi:hypothetical protein
MAEVDSSFSRGIGIEVTAGAAAAAAPSGDEFGAGAAAGGDIPRSIWQTAGEAFGAVPKVGGGRVDRLER